MRQAQVEIGIGGIGLLPHDFGQDPLSVVQATSFQSRDPIRKILGLKRNTHNQQFESNNEDNHRQ